MTSPQLIVGMVQAVVAEALKSVPRGVGAFQAEVATVSGAAVTVSWNDKTFPVPYLAQYTPAVGHQVLVLLADTDPIILGRIVGTPGS